MRVLFILLLFPITAQLLAGKSVYDPYTYNGSVSLENKSVPMLTVNGASSLFNVTVEQIFEVHGAVSLRKCTLGDVATYGSVSMDDSTVRGHSDIHGSLSVNYSFFHSVLSVKGSFRSLSSQYKSPVRVQGDLDDKNSTFDTLELEKNGRFYDSVMTGIICTGMKPQTIFLQGNATVLGDIVFSTVNGTVYAQKKEQVQGAIYGGTLVLRTVPSLEKTDHAETEIK